MNIKYLFILFCLLLVLVKPAVQSPLQPVQVHLSEYKISQNNDTEYVNQIMRLAKSAEMRNYMSNESEPCDDFYSFACGNWPKINPASHEKHVTTIFELLDHTYNQKLLKYLQEDVEKNDSTIERKVKEFFSACLNLGGIQNKKRYKLKLREIISEFGEMPALVRDEIWEAKGKFDWLETIGKIQYKYGLDIILQLGIRRDFNAIGKNKLFVGQPSLHLEAKSMYLNEETETFRSLYINAIKKDLIDFLDLSEEKASVTANQIFNFEKELSRGLRDERSGLSLRALSVPRTLSQIQNAYQPILNISKFITTSLGFELNDTFYEFSPEYQQNLVKVIRQSSEKELANYIFFQLIRVFFYKLDEPKIKRENICLDKTKKIFANVLDKAMYQLYNHKHIENDVNLIWSKIKETFKQELESEKLSWMSPITRKIALEKLSVITLEINSYEKNNFTSEFAGLNIRNRDFIHNIKTVLSFQTQKAIKKLNDPPKVEESFALSYSPAFISIENTIKIPIKILQPNYLWSDYYPNALKFGTLGYLIAHELLHGFDDLGRYVDSKGDANNWWDQKTTSAFNENKLCFKNQYARFRYGGKYLPESELQAENIADNGAVQIAYTAYNNWLKDVSANFTEWKNDTSSKEFLPKMDFSNRQLFFIAFAQFWCNDVDDIFKYKVSLIDIHAPAKFRVIGPLSNYEAFSKEFQCSKGSTMNPFNKCQLY